MKYLKLFGRLNEAKSVGKLYHFTSLSDAIHMVELNRMYSTQNAWAIGRYNKLHGKHTGQISFTRDKFLYRDKPKGVKFGVRFVFDGDKLSNDYKINPVKFSTLWDESEEAVFTIGGWNDRGNLKRHQIFNLPKYIISIDIMPADIYVNKVESYELDNYELIGIKYDPWDSNYDDSYISSIGKPKRPLINIAKKWFESKGYKSQIVFDKITKKSYLNDK